jgi:hypothetical protein
LNALRLPARLVLAGGRVESGRPTLEEFQHQVQSVFLCIAINYSDGEGELLITSQMNLTAK